MVNLKKYNLVLRFFVLFLTFLLSVSCAEQKYYVTKIEGKDIGITNKNKDVAFIFVNEVLFPKVPVGTKNIFTIGYRTLKSNIHKDT
jgi:hypothetical protein